MQGVTTVVSVWVILGGAAIGVVMKTLYDYRKWRTEVKRTPAEFLPRIEHLKVGKVDVAYGMGAGLITALVVGFIFLGIDLTPFWELPMLLELPAVAEAYKYAFFAAIFIGAGGDYLLDKLMSQADVQVFDIQGLPTMSDIGSQFGWSTIPIDQVVSQEAKDLETEIEKLPWVENATVIKVPRGPGTQDVYVVPTKDNMPMKQEQRNEAMILIASLTPAFVQWELKEPEFMLCNFQVNIISDMNPTDLQPKVDTEVRNYIRSLEVGEAFSISRAIFLVMQAIPT